MIRERRWWLGLVWGTLFLVATASLPAGARGQVTRLKQRQQHVTAQQRQLQSQLRDAAAAQSGLLARIGRLDKQRAETKSQIHSLASHIERLDARIASTRAHLHAAKHHLDLITAELQRILRRLDARTTTFTDRAIARYEAGPTAGIEALLTSHSFGDLMDRYTYYQSAMSSDARLIERIKTLSQATEKHRSAAETQRNAILAAKRKLETDRRTLDHQRRRKHHALASFSRLISAKRAAVSQIAHKKSQLRQAIAENARESAQIQALLAAAQGQTGSARGQGQLLWPAAGPITSGFGWRIHPLFHTPEFHPGIDIGAPYGAPVRAADQGVVEFAGTMSGYGNVVLIDHGGGLATLYGHLSAYSVSLGQTVARGAPIANVGCTGWCTGPHLHFEVRLSGRPVNPVPYLR